LRQWKPGGCEFDVDSGSAENTYATEKVILEVELEVGVLLDGAEDLLYIVSIASKRTYSSEHTLTPSAVT
jgi:hypothetical protein